MPPREDRPPNVLILFADQLRADVLDDPRVDTPALDALAASGTVFDAAYTPSPVCVPARSSFVTGLEPQSGGCFENGSATARASTFMDALTEAGYRTHGIGKMHFTPDLADLRGFESREVGEEFGSVASDDYLRHVADAGFAFVEHPLGLRDEMYYVPQLSPVPEELHHSHWVADRSIAFLEEQDAERPFLLWSSFIAPHPPFAPPSPWHRRYEPSVMPDPFVPAGSASLLTVWNDLQNRYKYRDGGSDRRLAQLVRAFYHASVSHVDAQVARILAALERSGLAGETYVLLAADHGELLGDYGAWGKRSFLDAAARIPFVLRGPGVGPGRCPVPVSLTDAYATILGIAGVGADPRDGQDVRTLPERRTVFGQYQHGRLGMYAIVTEHWKYVWSAFDRRELLLDRVHDPRETMNLAYNPRRRTQLERMRARAAEHFDDLVDLDWDAVTDNGRFSFGDPDDDAGARTLRSLGRDRDAGTLVVRPHPEGDDDPDG